MNLFLLLIGIGLRIRIASAESGDCENRDNPKDRNIIHNGTLEVDPCVSLILKKCINPEASNCSLSSNSSDDSPYEFILGDFEPKSKSVKFALILPFATEFWVVAHDSDADGNVNDGAINIGYFVDNVFPFCNSYACCDPQTKGKSNVARRCPTANDAPTKIPDRPGFYGLTYIFYPPRGFVGDFIFVAVFSDSESLHYSEVKSNPVRINATERRTTPSPQIIASEKPTDNLAVTDKPNINIKPSNQITSSSILNKAVTASSVVKPEPSKDASIPPPLPPKKKRKRTTTTTPKSISKRKKKVKPSTSKPKPKAKAKKPVSDEEEDEEEEDSNEASEEKEKPKNKIKKEGKKSTPASPEDGLSPKKKKKPKNLKGLLFGLRRKRMDY